MGLDQRALAAVERWTLILAGIAIALAWVLAERRFSLGVSVGAGLMVANAWALQRIGARILATASKRPGAAILLFNAKMVLLAALVYLVIRYAPVDAIGVLVGVSVFPVAVVAAALQMSTTDHDADAPAAPHGDR